MPEMYVPTEGPSVMPLLVLFHGSGRDGDSQIAVWQSLADKEKVILLAPSSLNATRGWGGPKDDQNMHRIFGGVFGNPSIDQNRIYLAGHSLGASYALWLGMVNASRFAAVAAHSPPNEHLILNLVVPEGPRKVFVGIWVGEERCDVNHYMGNAIQNIYKERHNIRVFLSELENHAHNDYYTRVGLTDHMWSFLKDKSVLQSSDSSTSSPQ